MDLQGKTLLFLGDSITWGAGASCPENIYWNKLGSMTGSNCLGFGIGGTRIAVQKTPSPNPEHDLYFASRLDSMPDTADVVVVFGGTNDYGHGDAPMGRMEDRTPETFYGALHDLCLKLLHKYPTARIIFMTPLHRTREDVYTDNEYGVRRVGVLRDYVVAIREVCEYYSLPVLDLYSVSGFRPDIPIMKKTYATDGLHPNDAGHERIACLLKGFLSNL